MILAEKDMPLYWFKLMINDAMFHLLEGVPGIKVEDFVIVDRDETYLRPDKHVIYIYEDFPQGDKLLGSRSDYYTLVCAYQVRIHMARKVKSVNMDEDFGKRLTHSLYDLLNDTNMQAYNFPQMRAYTFPRHIGFDLDESKIYEVTFRCLFSKEKE